MPHEDPIVCAELTRLSTAVGTIGAKMDALHDTLEAHVSAEAKLREELDEMHNAFPDGPERHREAHEEMIRAYKAQQKFWEEFWTEAKRKGIWFTFYAALGLLIIGLKVKFIGWFTGHGS